jgi:predicted ATPase/signal transduction histidine kinase
VNVLSYQDSPARIEVVHESERARISRVFLPTGVVVRKEPLGPDALRRLQREVAMLERLRGVAGVAQLLHAPQYSESIVLEHAGDRNLGSSFGPVPTGDLVGLAVGLARAVAEMHRRGVIHRDIAPANIVISREGSPCLVDFALATSVAEIRPEFTHQSAILGTLAYMAPEQTGRTARPVDQRADLYALGATLYHLATGEPPFGSGDALRLIHDHLARVPEPPAARSGAVPTPLSEIIMHLLEKEPDHRYQTADGLLHDLGRLRDGGPGARALRVGGRDLPERLLPLARLVGRDVELAALEAAFKQAVQGRCRGVFVSGAPGVGKTALIDQLRAVVARSDGWFVSGKFDHYRRDLDFNAGNQAFRALGRLLLAEPEDELRHVRERILGAVGANAGLLTAVIPEFGAVLAVPADPGDPLTAQARVQRAGAEALRAVASPTRPVVMFIDDLQWATRVSVGFVDLLLSEEPIDGLLLVCAYREDDVDETHPLAAALSRWRELKAVRHLRLANLSGPSLSALLGEMLRAEPSAAAQLVRLIEPQTRGNPYETVELLDALRRDGLLAATGAGWRWDQAAISAHLGRSELATLLAARVEAMAPSPRELVEAMACLGGRAERRLLRVATDTQDDALDRALAPAVEDGVLVLEPGQHEAVRFRHDRIREAVLDRVDAEQRRPLQLAMARRLASVPELFAVAAEQYLQFVKDIDDPRERRHVVALLRQAADQAALTGDYGRVNALLTAALQLIRADDQSTLVEVHTSRHSALFNLGRLEEADDEYRTIIGLAPGAPSHAATTVQVRSLTHRNRFAEAIGLGVRSLGDCGVTVPSEKRRLGEIDAAFETVYQWLQDSDIADDLARPDISDPGLIDAGHLIDAMIPAVYFTGDHALLGWLSLEALRLWMTHGPGRTLVGPAVIFGHAAMELRGDYAAGYQTLRRLLAVSEARRYEPDTSLAVHYFITSMRFWFEPIENNVRDARRAREGCVAGGELHIAGHTFAPATTALLESAPSILAASAEVKAGLAFARRTGGGQTVQWLDGYRWLTDALRGESPDAADERAPDDKFADNRMALFYAHVNRAVAAAIFGDPGDLELHTSRAIELVPAASGHYETAWARLLRGLAVAGQARDAQDGEERSRLLSELDNVTRWLAARAADAPDNFGHLVLLLEAERAWAVADFRAASLAFDAARREVSQRRRPWHSALITERAARFLLAHGLGLAGEELLAQARREYLAWGATAKVDQLDWAYPTLRHHPDTTAGDAGGRPSDDSEHRSSVTTGTIDLLGILSASRALSSETRVERLRSRVIEVLGAMTGATGVHLLVWSEDRQAWVAAAPDSNDATFLIRDTEQDTAVPMTVLRYAQRVREPLVVSDATTDDRFARDPYFAELDSCSLLSVPILSRGTLQAVLLLENRLIRSAFSAERLEAVKLIASQLAVSLDNAHLYAELADSRARLTKAGDTERRKLERDLHDGAQQGLVAAMITLALARDQVDGASKLDATLSQVEAELEQALQELRELAHGLYPTELTQSGLSAAIRALGRRSRADVDIGEGVESRFQPQIEAALYYCCLEAVQNATKHAGPAAHTSIRLFADTHALHLEVQDDGPGFELDDVRDGVGLQNMRDRLGTVGGRVTIASEPGHGTRIAATVPLTDASARSGPMASKTSALPI